MDTEGLSGWDFLTFPTLKPAHPVEAQESLEEKLFRYLTRFDLLSSSILDEASFNCRKKRDAFSSPVGSSKQVLLGHGRPPLDLEKPSSTLNVPQFHTRLYCGAIRPCVQVCHDWFKSTRRVDRVCLENLPEGASDETGSEKSCARDSKRYPEDRKSAREIRYNGRHFSRKVPLIMGNAGGNPKASCENTLRATEAGLAAGEVVLDAPCPVLLPRPLNFLYFGQA
jgi:hypothetical protein